MKKVFISTGGTGGHIFPALAVAKALLKEGVEVCVISDERYKNYPSRVETNNFDIFFLPISSPRNKLKFIFSLLSSTMKTIKLFLKFKPNAVIAFGGYPTMPVLIVSTIFRIKFILHEANTILGKVNKLFLPFCSHLTLGMPLKYHISNNYKYTLIGNPVTSNITASDYPIIDKIFKILILGGSQGASVMTNYVSRAIVEISKNVQYEIEVFHQSPVNEIEANKEIYSDSNIKVEVKDFFTNISIKILEAHLIITRAGAGTISEILNIGRPAIYIPYPSSAENHQLYNAKFVEEHNAGFIINEDENLYKFLIEKLNYLIKNKAILKEISKNASNLSKKNSTLSMVNIIKNLH